MTTENAGSVVLPDFPLLTPNVGIVGFSEGHVHEAPYDDPLWELWGINRLHTITAAEGKRFTRWFNLHDLEQFHGRDEEHLAFLKEFPGPVFLRPQDIGKFDIPNQVPFPIEEVIRRFGRYFNNTISYLLAYAIILQPEQIGVYGVDMAQDHLMSAEYCLSGRERVLTADLRWVEAGKVQQGDSLVAFDEHHNGRTPRQWRTATVESVSSVYLPTYRLTMEDGSVLVSSGDHRWLAYRGHNLEWRRTENLRTGDHLSKPLDTWDYDESREAGYLAGCLDSDGYFSQQSHMQLGFAQADNAMAYNFERFTAGLRWDISKRPHGQANISNYNVRGGVPSILAALGSVRPSRLLGQVDPHMWGSMRSRPVRVISVEAMGHSDLIALKTSTATFVAEGYASHNSQQRPSCEYMLGIAAGLGITLHLPKGSDLLKTTHLYGFEDPDVFIQKCMNRLQEVGQRKEQAKQQMAQIDYEIAQMQGRKQEVFAAINQLDGAMQNVQYWLRNWVPQPAGEPVVESPNGKVMDAKQDSDDLHGDRNVPVN